MIHKGQRYDGVHDGIIDREIWGAVQAQLKNNAGHRRAGTNAKSPSPLAGLLWDENGGRLMPSHACKAGKRYRYYVAAHDKDGFSQTGWRLPAKEIERVVMDGLVSFLTDRARLAGCLSVDNASPDALNRLFEGAVALARLITDGTSSEKKVILQDLVHRIGVGAEQVSVAVSADHLLGLLKGPDRASGDVPAEQSEMIMIRLPVSFRRSAQGEKLIIAAGDAPASNPDQQLIRAVALGHSWLKEIKGECVASLGNMAERHGVARREAGRIFRLGLLAPDIAEAILDGRQPPKITFRRLNRLSNIPVSWAEQRKFLGFPE